MVAAKPAAAATATAAATTGGVSAGATSSSLTKRVLRLDAGDAWHRVIKYLMALPLLLYSVSFLFDKHKLNFLRVPLLNGQTRDLLYAVAKDGLIVPIRETETDKWPENNGWSIIDFHAFAAMALLLCVVFQKQSAMWMLTDFKGWVTAHRYVGRVAMGLVAIMCYYGWEMARFITLKRFDVFIYLFIAPFATFSVLLYATASPKWIAYHRLFANMLVKGVVGTPLARLAGMLLQSFHSEQPNDRDRDYYYGIGMVTLVLGLWQVIELGWFAVIERKQLAASAKKHA